MQTRTRLPLWHQLSFAAAILAVYLLLPNANFSFDTLGYMQEIKGTWTPRLLHPHHLLFQPLALFFHRMTHLLADWDPMRTTQVLNSIGGGIGALLLLRLLLTLVDDWAVALLATAFAAFSYAYWFHSIEGEVYILPIAFLVGGAFILLRARRSVRNAVGLGLMVSAAILLHQSHVLFIAVCVAYLALADRRLGYVLWFVATCALVIGPAYLLAAHANDRLLGVQELMYWLTLYAHIGDDYGILSWKNFPLSALGLVRAHFAAHEIGDSLRRQEVSAKAIAVGLLLLAHASALAVIVFRSWNARQSTPKTPAAHSIPLFCALWIAAYGGFAFYWEPANFEFWAPVIIPVQMLLVALARWDRINRWLLALVVATVFVSNLIDSIYTDSFIENNEHYVLATKLHGLQVHATDLVFVTRSTVDDTSAYFYGEKLRVMSLASRTVAPNTHESFREAEAAAVETLSRGFRVFLSGGEFSSVWEPSTVRWKAGQPSTDYVAQFVERLGTTLEPRFQFQLDGQRLTMYELARR